MRWLIHWMRSYNLGRLLIHRIDGSAVFVSNRILMGIMKALAHWRWRP